MLIHSAANVILELILLSSLRDLRYQRLGSQLGCGAEQWTSTWKVQKTTDLSKAVTLWLHWTHHAMIGSLQPGTAVMLQSAAKPERQVDVAWGKGWRDELDECVA